MREFYRFAFFRKVFLRLTLGRLGGEVGWIGEGGRETETRNKVLVPAMEAETLR